ncbi:MAG: hypothetical protein ABT940_14240 [Alphaproteobacteria bacterium]
MISLTPAQKDAYEIYRGLAEALGRAPSCPEFAAGLAESQERAEQILQALVERGWISGDGSPQGMSTIIPAALMVTPASLGRAGPAVVDDPLGAAIHCLGVRLRRCRGGLILDGQAVGSAQVVAAANAVLVAAGRAPIAYPGIAPVLGRNSRREAGC